MAATVEAPPRMKFTKHARDRIREMEVSPEEVDDALYEPEVRWDSNNRKGKRPRHMQRAGRVAVVIEHHPKYDLLITVLWNTYEKYTRQQ